MEKIFSKCNELIPKNAIAIHNILNNKGFETYFVGGALRDFYLSEVNGKPYKIKDWDMVTTASHCDMQNIFNKILRINENGKVVSRKGKTELLIPQIQTTGVSINNQIFEVTPMHVKNGDDIRFINNIYDDLANRDFTMNALAYSPKNGLISEFKNRQGKIIRPIEDIEKGVIRAVNNPNKLFTENRYAMVRAILFAQRFGFEIDEETLGAIRDNIFGVNEINKGKMSKGFEKLITTNEANIFDIIEAVGFFEALVIGFNRKYLFEMKDIFVNVIEGRSSMGYFERLRFIYNNFSNKELIIELYRELGVNKDVLIKLN